MDLNDKISFAAAEVEEGTTQISGGLLKEKCCTDCQTTKTPLWRGGPSGPKSLCNACGIKYNKKRRTGFDKDKTGTSCTSKGNGDLKLKVRLMVINKNQQQQQQQKKKKKQHQRKRSSYERGKPWWNKLREEEQAAILLMAISCGGGAGSLYS